MEPVFRTLEIAAKAAMRATGTRITYHGLENIPATSGAVIAINHTSYIDFLPAALAVHHRKRRMRFMIKAEMQEVKIVSWLIKHTKTIPVDRRAGAGAYTAAVEQLRNGELVGVYPEATISRSFELKEFKTGAGGRTACGQRTIRSRWAATSYRSPLPSASRSRRRARWSSSMLRCARR
jgi:1-acyl-sn-glycerol-3-phosphate acyltransferase